MSEMLSPAVYLRCSENSTENPWNGLACRPEMNPSTMNLARRSSRATWRMTSGFRYFSAVPAKLSSSDQPLPTTPATRPMFDARSEDLGQRDFQAGELRGGVGVGLGEHALGVALGRVAQDGDAAVEAIDKDIFQDLNLVILGPLRDVIPVA